MLKNKPIISNPQSIDFNNYQLKYTSEKNDAAYDLANNSIKILSDAVYQKNNITFDNNPIEQDEFENILLDLILNDDVDHDKDELMSIIISELNKNKLPNIENWNDIYGLNYLIDNNMPIPSVTATYSYNWDIKKPANSLYTTHSKNAYLNTQIGLTGTLLQHQARKFWKFILIDNKNYTDIKKEINNTFLNSNNTDLIKANNDIQQISLNNNDTLTTWVTGADISAESINRYINAVINAHTQNNNTVFTPLNINIKGSLCPQGYVFINIESLAKTDQESWSKELNDLIKITNKLITFNAISLQHIKSGEEYINDKPTDEKLYDKSLTNEIAKRKAQTLSNTMPTTDKQLKRLKRLVSKYTSKQETDNIFRTRKRSYMRPNRRNPDDTNLQGSYITKAYRPDIHIYLDTSGSITEAQYKQSITMLIKISKILNTNLYFTSFSDRIAQPVKLMTKNASVKQIYKQIQTVPKVGGGTEFENVWNMIDTLSTKKNMNMLNFVLTDFEYNIRYTWTPRIKNDSTKATFYLPLAANQNDYSCCKRYAEELANELIDAGDLNIKKRILM